LANQKILDKKQEIINEISEKTKDASSVVLFEYQGLTAMETNALRRILRDYDRYISESNGFKRNKPQNDLRVEYVKNFDAIINIRDSIEKPILYHEEVEGERAVFYIFDDRVVYIYVMRAYELKKKN